MNNPSFSDVSFEEVLKRLTFHSIMEFRALGALSADGVVSGLGVGPDDLAMQVLVNFMDPTDPTVSWKKKRGRATTKTVVTYLKTVLRNDLKDLLKRKAHRTTVAIGGVSGDCAHEDRPPRSISLVELVDVAELQDERAIRVNLHGNLLRHFEDDSDLRDVLAAQLDPDGYQAYTNQDLAELLGTSVVDIQNRKKRIRRRLSCIHTNNTGWLEDTDHG